MNQSSSIVAALLIGFIVFVTLRGELPSYKAIVLGDTPPPNSPNSAKGNSDIEIPEPIAPVRVGRNVHNYTPADVGLNITQQQLDDLINNGTIIPPKR